MTAKRPKSPVKARRLQRSGDAAQRDAIAFDPIDMEFNADNERWALTHLPQVRLAVLLLKEDHNGLQEKFGKLVAAGRAPQMMDDLAFTENHLRALADLCDTALARGYLVLERLGYTPDNPPPDYYAEH